MGRDHIEPPRLRRRYHEKWVEELSLLKPDYDFETEARRLIEHALLFGLTPVLPIDGRDIMEEFQIQPGPQVGQILVQARAIYESALFSRSSLTEAQGENHRYSCGAQRRGMNSTRPTLSVRVGCSCV